MNVYDSPKFFKEYGQMLRSKSGLKGAGEWGQFQKMLPDLADLKILDLGCGYGWHCRYAIEQGAREVIGIDSSHSMLEKARSMTTSPRITYREIEIEEMNQLPNDFDLIFSSLALHYIKNFSAVVQQVNTHLKPNGRFIFSVEHPIFTAHGKEDWRYDSAGKIEEWPVDRYFEEGGRDTLFLQTQVQKYHRTLMTYLQTLLKNGFKIIDVVEPTPSEKMLAEIEGMQEELRRPMMLLISAQKD